MAKEICISSTPLETRLAILEDDQLAEIYYERENEYTLAGSIYNGRVTRVLPGMQSAFVDLGLKRDAFLYVTDFMELEDPEETDELEKAAASGAAQPPREVRHPHGGNGSGVRQVPDERGSRSGQRRPEPRPEIRNNRPVVEEVTIEPAVPEPASIAAPIETAQEQEETGGRRWRGRRRRRGGRGQNIAPEAAAQSEPSVPRDVEPTGSISIEFEEASPAHQTQSAPPAPHVPHAHQAPQAFVLPGESLSRYGGTAAAETPEKTAPTRPRSTFKPSTLIEAPITWDGSGPLPGESLSRHRSRQLETEEPVAEAPTEISAAPHVDGVIEETVEEARQETEASYYETETETKEPEQTALVFEEESLGADAFNALAEDDEDELETAVGAMEEEDEFEETMESAPAESKAVQVEPAEAEVTDEETDASAS
ncbi:MAG: ribonuclease, partial [Terracidiphilus sp.]